MCQLGNNATKTKQANKHGKKREKRKLEKQS